jgi:hypothetical protein
VLTGSYHNYFRIYDVNESGDKDAVLQADKSAFKAKKIGGPKGQGKGPNGTGKKEGLQTENIDFAKKIVSTAVAGVSQNPSTVLMRISSPVAWQLASTGEHDRCKKSLMIMRPSIR